MKFKTMNDVKAICFEVHHAIGGGEEAELGTAKSNSGHVLGKLGQKPHLVWKYH